MPFQSSRAAHAGSANVLPGLGPVTTPPVTPVTLPSSSRRYRLLMPSHPMPPAQLSSVRPFTLKSNQAARGEPSHRMRDR